MQKLALPIFAALLTVSLLSAADEPPNFIIIMVDDMGFAGPSISPYSNPNYETPGMDQLAREGMRFTDFHSSGSVCSPTRAGLLTGRYQQRAGIEAVIHPYPGHPEHRKGLRKSETTFAELFQKNGYATGIIGKWHIGYPEEDSEFHPQNHGFDYFRGYHSGNIDYINHWGDHYEHDWWHDKKETIEDGYTTHLINRYALEFIEENQDRPFCLYVAHESPHAPIQGPDDPIQRGPGMKERITPQDEAMKQMILEMDKGVEEIRSRIVSFGLEMNTFIMFFSDNGDAPNTNTGSPKLRGHKGSLYEGGHRVPAIAWWPGKVPANTVSDALGISIDVMPTILSIAGIKKPDSLSLDGIDISPILFDESVSLPERSLFWAGLSNSGRRSEAVREGPWKLVVQHPDAPEGTYENETAEIYNLDEDLAESTDLAKKMPNRVNTMLAALHDWLADTERTRTPQPGSWLETTSTGREMNEAFYRFRDEKQQFYNAQFGGN